MGCPCAASRPNKKSAALAGPGCVVSWICGRKECIAERLDISATLRVTQLSGCGARKEASNPSELGGDALLQPSVSFRGALRPLRLAFPLFSPRLGRCQGRVRPVLEVGQGRRRLLRRQQSTSATLRPDIFASRRWRGPPWARPLADGAAHSAAAHGSSLGRKQGSMSCGPQRSPCGHRIKLFHAISRLNTLISPGSKAITRLGALAEGEIASEKLL